MSNFYKKDYTAGEFWVSCGADISDTIIEAIEMAGQNDSIIRFTFNGVAVRVAKDSNSSLIYRDWKRALCSYIPDPVGPYPSLELSAEELAKDAAIAQRHTEQREQEMALYRQSEENKMAELARLIEGEPFDCIDQTRWDAFVANNKNEYGGGIILFSEQWARLMQVYIAQGKSISDMAMDASHQADTVGLSGAAFGCAVATLTGTWRHGEELRRWNNRYFQIGTEGEAANESGGVLNPALLIVGGGKAHESE